MWILVVLLVDGAGMYSYAEGVPYKSRSNCAADARSTYQSLMTTRPSKEAYVVAYCSEVPKGI